MFPEDDSAGGDAGDPAGERAGESRADAAAGDDPPGTSGSGYSRERAEFYHERQLEGGRPDVDFYVERALAVDGPVLEMACGTGRIYLPLLDVGVDADGFDRSSDALALLRETASEVGFSPSVWRADMTAFGTDRSYDLVVCPFNAVQHLLTVEDQLAALREAHRVLAPGGRLVFDVFVPRFDHICDSYGELDTETVEYRGAPHALRTLTELVDEVEQVIRVTTELFDPDGGTVFTERHRLKLLPKREVELLVRLSPFGDWTATSNFGDAPLADGDTVQVWTLEKEA
ncbi:MAG: class I SAM-dependent methyltransferase [Haloarculaceae archaeon]